MKILRYLLLIITLCGIIFLPENPAYCWDIIDIILKDSISGNTPGNDNDFYFLPPMENKDFFQAIDDLSICRNREVRKYIFLYLNGGRLYLDNAIVRSNRYIGIIEEIFAENKDIPPDISLLPLLESAFNPRAVSRSKAVGLWQFVRITSKDLSLKNNLWVDERMDIEKSTAAAIIHMRHLYKMFNSWELALAAYNGGAGYIKKTMNKTRSKTIADLLEKKVLNKETSEYLHRFAALLVLFKNQALFNIEIAPLPVIETGNIILQYPVRVSQVSEITGVPMETIRLFNPELNKDVTPPYEKNYSLRLPVDALEKFELNKSQLKEIKYTSVKKHIVKKGEYLGKIAKLYKTNIKTIVAFNGIKNADSIKPGSELYIPI